MDNNISTYSQRTRFQADFLHIVHIFCFIILFQFCNSYQSFAHERELRFLHITTDNGLSNNIINCILQDHQGYMWIGTMEGLNRFDGYSNRIFKKELDNPTSLLDNMIYAIAIDHLNNIWIGTQYGLCLYHPEKENFSRFVLDTMRTVINAANRVTGIDENSKNELFIAVELGSLYSYDRTTGKFINEGHNFNSIKDFIIDSDDKFWLGGVDGLYLYDRINGTVKTFSETDSRGQQHAILDVNTLFEDGDTIWVGTIKGRIYYILKSSLEVKLLNYTFEETYYIYDIFKGNDGYFYISTTSGLFIYDKSDNKVSAYKYQKDNPYGLNGAGVTQVYQDIQGNFWVGAYQGGVNLSTYGKAFKNYNSFSKEITLDIVNINCLFEDSRGNLWLGSFDRGINMIDPVTNKRKLYLNSPSDKHSLGFGSVFKIFEDSKNNIWVGTYLGYLQRLDKLTGTFISYPFNPELGQQSKGLDVRSIVEDTKGNLWILSHGNGLSRFNPRNAEYKHFRRDNNNLSTTIADDWAFQILVDKLGIFWIATPSGLSRFDPSTEIFTNFNHDDSDTLSLCHNFVTTIFEDSKGNLWVGTKYGLDLFDRQKKIFLHFYEKNGLPSNQIKAILEHKRGELWISTGNGLSRMRYAYKSGTDRVVAEFRNFNNTDNLQDIFFWDRSAVELHDTQLVFGSEKGIVVFNPDEIADNKRIPEVYITGFRIFNKEVVIGDFDSLLSQTVSSTQEIKLKYDQNFFTLEFVAINYISNENNQYRYMMEGFDTEWIYAGNKREATYTNLDPGKYIFRVKASNNDGYWNESGTSIRLIITPPYWETWWFRVLVFIAVISLAVIIYLYRIRNLKDQNITLENRVKERTEELSTLNFQISEQNKLLEVQKNNIEDAFDELTKYRTKLEELVEERTHELILAKERAEESDKLKTSFLANLSHEIRTPLNSIIGFSGLMLDPDITNEERISFKTIIEGSNNTLLNLINDIIDFSKIESGHIDIVIGDVSINKVFSDLKEIFRREILQQTIKDPNSVEFRINVNKSLNALIVKTDEIRLKQILSNLISNAIKFTNKGFIEVGCNPFENDGMLEFYVRDTGIGIKKEFIEIIFQRFRKVEEDNTSIYRGAGLGLAISQQLVKLLGGKMRLETEYQNGSTFFFTIPFNTSKLLKSGQNGQDFSKKIPLLDKCVILIAEDDFANFSYLEKLLMKTRAQILHASNGKQAVSIANANHDISLILMDIKMPEMNGIEALHELRRLNISVPVIAQTAYAFSEEMRNIRAAGFSDYISKPIDAKELFASILKHLQV